ncbi:MAG: hypothetical protein R3E84_20460 [Pseudomonadales bacterium]
MLDEVVSDLVQPVVGGDDLIVACRQLSAGPLVQVQLGFLDLLGDAVVEVEPRDAQLLAAVLALRTSLTVAPSSSGRLKS